MYPIHIKFRKKKKRRKKKTVNCYSEKQEMDLNPAPALSVYLFREQNSSTTGEIMFREKKISINQSGFLF